MPPFGANTQMKPVATARAVVHRVDGTVDVYYSSEKVPIRQLRRWLTLRKHLRFMRAEDRKAGYG